MRSLLPLQYNERSTVRTWKRNSLPSFLAVIPWPVRKWWWDYPSVNTRADQIRSILRETKTHRNTNNQSGFFLVTENIGRSWAHPVSVFKNWLRMCACGSMVVWLTAGAGALGRPSSFQSANGYLPMVLAGNVVCTMTARVPRSFIFSFDRTAGNSDGGARSTRKFRRWSKKIVVF
jgi:hypothetical protein